MNQPHVLNEVIILNDFASFNGGASVVALHSALELARQGVRVTLFSAVGPIDATLAGVPNLEVVCLDQEEIVRDPNRLRALVRGAWNRPAARARPPANPRGSRPGSCRYRPAPPRRRRRSGSN